MRFLRPFTRVLWTCLAIALCVMPLVDVGGPAPAAATTSAARPAIGVHFHGTWLEYSRADSAVILDRLAAAGVTWVRIDLGWASYEERCSGCISQWYVDRADSVIDMARARGLKVLAQVGMVPGWANGERGTATPPLDPAEFGRFMGWLGAHLRGRVQAYELWNEPNHLEFWNGSASEFVGMVRAAYPRLKAMDPKTPVVLGGVSYNDSGWLRQAYDAGVGGYFDILATHPYLAPADLPPETADSTTADIYLLTHVESVRELMISRGDGAKAIWFTEFGWSSHENAGGEPNWERGVTDQQQADYLLRTLDLVGSRYPYVTNVFWYNDWDRGASEKQIDNYGLLARDLSPKPVYHALKQRLTGGLSVRKARSARACRTEPLRLGDRHRRRCTSPEGW
jgi:hypothetical protein